MAQKGERTGVAVEPLYGTCGNCGEPIEGTALMSGEHAGTMVWCHHLQGRHTVCNWHEDMEPTSIVATPLAQDVPITERLAGLVQDGRNIKGPDGKVEVFDGVPTLDSTLAEALDMWERAREQEQDAAAYVERRQAEALDALRESDEQYRAQETRMEHYEAKRKGIEAAIAAALTRSDPDVTLSVDSGRVRLTWPKRTTRWTLAQEPQYYATAAARKGLMELLLDVADQVAGGMVPVARAQAQAIIDWLSPTPKHSAPTGPRYTVREDK